MKYCPTCHISYADDDQQFCFQDGTSLLADNYQHVQTPIDLLGEEETVVHGNPPVPRSNPLSQSTALVTPQFKNSNAFIAVLLTILIMLLIFGGGISMWAYFGNLKNDYAQKNLVPVNSNSGAGLLPLPASSMHPTPTPTPITSITPLAPASSIDAEKIRTEVSSEVSAWKSDMESRNFSMNMSHYADTLEYYYRKGSTPFSSIQNDKKKAFSKFDNIRVAISNMNVIPDVTGESATAIFDKEWSFTGPGKSFSGKVQSQLLLKKINGRWLIAGEKDLKNYRVNN
jgi:hypothetical protein